jgi:nicotinate-nucleotide adenylyltransferase
MKIGIFGGSFDPPHMGHFWICQNAIDCLGLDIVHIIPNALSPFKEKHFVEPHHRYYMSMQLANEVNAIVDDQELNRPEPSYTWDTILNMRGRYPKDELYFIMGSDSLADIYSWYRYDDIISEVIFAVAPRIDYDGPIIRNEKVKEIKGPSVQISSTELRFRLKNRKIITRLIPEKVLDYIEVNKLYL